ncbi:MAG: ParB/RepB/Spo0J family partition protein [Thermoproteota archaeon]
MLPEVIKVGDKKYTYVVKEIDIDSIKYLQGTYPRVSIIPDLIVKYAEAAKSEGPDIFPPIVLTKDYFIIDGVHRFRALKSLDVKSVKAAVLNESVEPSEVVSLAVKLNSTHGRNLTPEDLEYVKRLIVSLEEHPKMWRRQTDVSTTVALLDNIIKMSAVRDALGESEIAVVGSSSDVESDEISDNEDDDNNIADIGGVEEIEEEVGEKGRDEEEYKESISQKKKRGRPSLNLCPAVAEMVNRRSISEGGEMLMKNLSIEAQQAILEDESLASTVVSLGKRDAAAALEKIGDVSRKNPQDVVEDLRRILPKGSGVKIVEELPTALRGVFTERNARNMIVVMKSCLSFLDLYKRQVQPMTLEETLAATDWVASMVLGAVFEVLETGGSDGHKEFIDRLRTSIREVVGGTNIRIPFIRDLVA